MEWGTFKKTFTPCAACFIHSKLWTAPMLTWQNWSRSVEPQRTEKFITLQFCTRFVLLNQQILMETVSKYANESLWLELGLWKFATVIIKIFPEFMFIKITCPRVFARLDKSLAIQDQNSMYSLKKQNIFFLVVMFTWNVQTGPISIHPGTLAFHSSVTLYRSCTLTCHMGGNVLSIARRNKKVFYSGPWERKCLIHACVTP